MKLFKYKQIYKIINVLEEVGSVVVDAETINYLKARLDSHQIRKVKRLSWYIEAL